MSDKKKTRYKSDKSQNKKDKDNDDWRELLTKINLCDIPCSCLLSVISESNAEQIIYTNLLCNGSQLSLRRSIRILSKNDMIKNILQAEIFRASSNPPNHFQVCEEALKIVKEGSKIPTELWILLIKFHILFFIEEYIFQKKREELMTGIDLNSQMNGAGSEVKELGKRKKNNSSKKETMSSEKNNSVRKVSDGLPVQQKPDSKIRHKNDEWKDIPCIDDAPPDGPDIYFLLIGFHDTDILMGLAAAGIPFLCFVKLFFEEKSTGIERISKIEFAKKQIDLRKSENKGQKKQKNKIQNVEEMTFEEQDSAINIFWEFVEQRKESTNGILFDDLPIVPFELPDLPSDEQMYSELGQTLYHRLSFLMYDIHCLKMKYLKYLQNMKIWLKNSADYIPRSEEMDIYNALMDKIPSTSITVPIILECMLMGVESGKKKTDFNSTDMFKVHPNIDPLQLIKSILPDVDRKYNITTKHKGAKLNCPKIINFGDELLMKMYHNLDSTIDAGYVPYHILQNNQISMLWNKYPLPSYSEKLFYCYHTRKFTEVLKNENLDYNVVFYLFCLLNFEEMLSEISKKKLKMREESSPLVSLIPHYVIETINGSILITLKQMKNLVSLSETVGHKILHLNDIKSEDIFCENYSKMFYLRKKNIKIELPDNDCSRIFKASREKLDMGVEVKTNEMTWRRNSIEERDSNTSPSNERINFSSQDQSESHSLHCKEMEDLFSNKDFSNLFKNTKHYGFVEQLTEQVLAQVIHSSLLTFVKFKYLYFKPYDVLLVLFYNPHDIERIHKHKWSANLPSPVSFRIFYDSVLYEEIDWLAQENGPCDKISSDQVTPSNNPHDGDCNTLISVNKEDFLLEDSIKYYEHLQKNLDETDTKSVKEKSSKSNNLNKKIQKKNVRKSDSEAEISTLKTATNCSNDMITSDWNLNVIDVKSAASGENEEENFHEGYDLGSERVEFSGEDTNFISSNGKMMVSVKSVLHHKRQKNISIEIELDKNSMFYHLKPSSESRNVLDNVLSFHLVLRSGVVIAFSKNVDTLRNSCITEKQKEVKEKRNEDDKLEMAEVKGMMEVNEISKCTTDKSFDIPGIKNLSNESLEWEASGRKDDLKSGFGFEMNLSLPSGLSVKRKTSCGSPSYIRQNYISKGKLGVMEEEFRIYLFNGNILKFMTNGEVFILCPNSTVYLCKNFELSKDCNERKNMENLEVDMEELNNINAKDYTILLPSGKYHEKIDDRFHELPNFALRYAADLEAEIVYINRGDGTHSVLQSDGQLTVNFPDNSCITTVLNIIEEDFFPDIVWEEGDSVSYFLNSDILQNDDNFEENEAKIIIGKSVVEEAYVVIYLNYHLEHPHYAAVYFDGLSESATITIPQNTVIDITKEGKYHLNVHNSVELDVMNSHAKFIHGNAESTLYFKINTHDMLSSLAKELLCTNNDGLGNIFTIKFDGTTNISRIFERDSVKEEKNCKIRLLAVKRDNSGAEFHRRKYVESYLAEAKLDSKVSVLKHLENDITEHQSPFFTILSPLTEYQKNNWLLPVENSADAIRRASYKTVRSTYWVDEGQKPASFWFNPFPKSKKRNKGTEFEQWDTSVGDVLCIRVLQQLSSLGLSNGRLSLVKIMLKAFQNYKNYIDGIHKIGECKIKDKHDSEDDSENQMESKIQKEKTWLDNSKGFVWNADVAESFIAGLLNNGNELATMQHHLFRNKRKRLNKLQSHREAAKKEQEDWMKLRNNVILPYHTLYSEQ